MAIGTHTGEQFESLFDLQIARQDAKQPVTGSDSEVKMAKDIELSFPPGVPVDSDTPGVATNPDAYYNKDIMKQPYRGGGYYEGRPQGGEPLRNRAPPMDNLSGKPKISLNEYEEASPFKIAMADMAPEGMRIPVSRIQQTQKQELFGGGGGGTTLDKIRAFQAEKDATEAWRKRITSEESTKGSSAFDWTPEKITKMQEMRSQGTSVSDIANELGVSKNSVVGKLNRLRGYLSPNQRAANPEAEPPIPRGPSPPRSFDPSLFE